MMMEMVVMVVREDVSIFSNRRCWRLVICLTFIRIFSDLFKRHIDDDGGDSGWKTVAAVYNWWSFGLADPFQFWLYETSHVWLQIVERDLNGIENLISSKRKT